MAFRKKAGHILAHKPDILPAINLFDMIKY